MTGLVSIAALTADSRAVRQRLSALVRELLDRAIGENGRSHIYTRIMETHAQHRVQLIYDQCGHEPDPGAAPLWPLLGVPIAVKDNIDVRGTETSCGTRSIHAPAAADADIVRALESRGAIILGKTNLDEAALGASGQNSRFGRCINPRDERLSSGGSSSGSAAAVAAGHVLLSVGTDTLGSVRIPAAFCGIAGFKPSHGRLSSLGVAPLYPRFDTVGLLARSLGDITCAAGLLLHPDPPDSADSADSAVPSGFTEIAVFDANALAGIDPSVARDYRRCVEAVRELAQIRLTVLPPVDFATLGRAAFWEVAHGFAAGSASAAPGFRPLEELGDELRRLLDQALSMPGERLAEGRELLKAAASGLRDCLSRTEAILTPTCPVATPSVREKLPRQVAAFASPANVAGLPAVCWPQSLGEQRTLSLQLVGRAGRDLQLLGLASRMQQLLDRQLAAGV